MDPGSGGEAPSSAPDVTGLPDPTRAYRALLRLSDVVGRSAALARLFRGLWAVARLDHLGILLTGATGTGKSLIARVLHENGSRAGGPFVAVNCAAIPHELWEAEFFGCARHAYTQASDRPGRFAAAEGGTLFLDEVAELSLEQQAKLLRVLDEGCYERLGEDHTRKTNVRIIAATNRPLDHALKTGAFRPELYFRLNRYRLYVPSLDERREDIHELATVLAERECKLLNLAPVGLSRDAIRLLEDHDWPGNVRQLHSVIAQAVVEAALSEGREILPGHCFAHEPPISAEPPRRTEHSAERLTFADATRCFQRDLIAAALREERGNVSRTARRLDLTRSHLYTLLRNLQIPRGIRSPR